MSRLYHPVVLRIYSGCVQAWEFMLLIYLAGWLLQEGTEVNARHTRTLRTHPGVHACNARAAHQDVSWVQTYKEMTAIYEHAKRFKPY